MSKVIENINRLPVNTWEWLGINSTSAETDGFIEGCAPVITAPEGVSVYDSENDKIDNLPKTGTGEFVDSLASVRNNIEIGTKTNAPIEVSYSLKPGEKSFARLHLTAEAGSEATVVIRLESAYDTDEALALFVSAQVEKDAKIKIIISQLLKQNSFYLGTITGAVAQNGLLDVTLIELGGERAISGCDIILDGEEAVSNINAVYAAGREDKRDLNYRMVYNAPKTEGNVKVRGVLSEKAHKVLKSTIDFKSGASESKGREEEYVLVLSDKVRNISTPLLLCGEDNVQGEHATNIGRPDEAKVYYLMTRGFSELEAKKILVEAAFAPIIAEIPNEVLRNQINERIEEVTEYGI